MKLKKLTSRHSPFAKEAAELYENAFPAHERFTKEDFLKNLELGNGRNTYMAVHGNVFVGLISFWRFEDFIFLEHIAVLTAQRGQRIGEKMILQLMEMFRLPIIAEVEFPHDKTAEKRLKFYDKLGFSAADREYKQPSYYNDENYYAMHLMCTNQDFISSGFGRIKSLIYKKVYGKLG